MTPYGRPGSLRATHRLAAVLVTLFWSAAPILAAIHANAEVHRYCAEHGMVEEGSPTRPQAAPDDRPAARDASAPAPEHDGCAFARVCRFGQVLGPLSLEAAGQLDPGARVDRRRARAAAGGAAAGTEDVASGLTLRGRRRWRRWALTRDPAARPRSIEAPVRSEPRVSMAVALPSAAVFSNLER